MKKNMTIPPEDLKAINDSFKTTRANVIRKDAGGMTIASGKDDVNKRGYVIQNFHGRKLRYDKFVIPVGGDQELVAKKGTLYDDIPEEQRKKGSWFEEDFE